MAQSLMKDQQCETSSVKRCDSNKRSRKLQEDLIIYLFLGICLLEQDVNNYRKQKETLRDKGSYESSPDQCSASC